jgi:hypothetical protein
MTFLISLLEMHRFTDHAGEIVDKLLTGEENCVAVPDMWGWDMPANVSDI